MRNLLAHAIAPIMRATGFRFSKEYRWETTRWKAFVYRYLSTVGANRLADRERWNWL